MPPGTRPVLNEPRVSLAVALLVEGGLACVAVAVGWAIDLDPFRTLHLTWTAAGIAVLASAPPLLLLRWLLATHRAPIVRLRNIVDAALGDWIGAVGWPALLLLALVAGLGEEAFFRGLLQDGAARLVGGLLAWIGASLVFGVLHFLTAVYALLAVGMGLYLGGVYVLTGNLFVPLVVHAIYDAVALTALARHARGRRAGDVAAAE